MTHELFMGFWNYWEKKHGLESPNANHDKSKRMTQFALTLESIIEHNSQPDKTYTKGLNKFSDMTDKEFSDYYMMDKTKLKEDQHCSATHGPLMDESQINIPKDWDWRQHGGVTPVKNQGHCGSCWTFSTVGALEAHELLKYKSFTPLSEQQLIDCAGDFDNHGCEGGLPSHAFEYIQIEPHGISTEKAYPYKAVDQKCAVDPYSYVLNVEGGSVNITEGDEVQLANDLFKFGPVSVAFEVVDGFRDYKSGVYSSKVCKNSTQDVNHAVLAVGYGVEKGTPYWIVKNSWGADWGDKGFFKIEKGVNMCGIAVCNAYPKEVTRLSTGANTSNFLQN
jgi:cathepsin H